MLPIETEPRGIYIARHKDVEGKYLAYSVDSKGCRPEERPFETEIERDILIADLWQALNLTDPVNTRANSPDDLFKMYVLPTHPRTPKMPMVTTLER